MSRVYEDFDSPVPWEAPDRKEFDRYFTDTPFNDSKKDEVLDLAEKLAKGVNEPRELAVNIWNWVVDNLKLCYEPPKSAVETIEEKEGNCFNRTNLQVILYRLNKIPARFTYTLCYRDYPKIFVPPDLVDQLPVNAFIHNTIEIYIDGKWIEADPFFDRPMLPFDYQWYAYDSFNLVVPDHVYANLGHTPNMLKDTLLTQFRNIGVTKAFCQKNIDPYTESVRNMSREEKWEHLEKIWGKPYLENFARHVYLKSCPYRRWRVPWDVEDPRKGEPSRWLIEDEIENPADRYYRDVQAYAIESGRWIL